MEISFLCCKCGEELTSDDSHLFLTLECPHCGKHFSINLSDEFLPTYHKTLSYKSVDLVAKIGLPLSFASSRFTETHLSYLCSQKGTKKIFPDLPLPLLSSSDDLIPANKLSYWDVPVTIFGQPYFLFKNWNENTRERLVFWLRQMNVSYHAIRTKINEMENEEFPTELLNELSSSTMESSVSNEREIAKEVKENVVGFHDKKLTDKKIKFLKSIYSHVAMYPGRSEESILKFCKTRGVDRFDGLSLINFLCTQNFLTLKGNLYFTKKDYPSDDTDILNMLKEYFGETESEPERKSYLDLLSSIKISKGNRFVTGIRLNKPIFCLSLIYAMDKPIVTENAFEKNTLLPIYNIIRDILQENSSAGDIFNPFKCLVHDGFWSVDEAGTGHLSPDMFAFLTSADNAVTATEVLLTQYFHKVQYSPIELWNLIDKELAKQTEEAPKEPEGVPGAPQETPIVSPTPDTQRPEFHENGLGLSYDAPNRNNDEKVFQVLSESFKKGFRLDSKIEIARFRNFWKEKFTDDCPYSDDKILDSLKSQGIEFQNKIYAISNLVEPEMIQNILDFIKSLFDSGKQYVYYQVIYDEFKARSTDWKLTSPDMIKTLLQAANCSYVLADYRVCAGSDAEVDPIVEIREILRKERMPVSYEKMMTFMPHVSLQAVKDILVSSTEFVNCARGEYIHADIVDFSEDELNTIADLIQTEIYSKSYIPATDLWNKLENEFPEYTDRYSYLPFVGFRDALKHKFSGKFKFKGNIISSTDKPVNNAAVFSDFAKNRSSFTLDDLFHLQDDLGVTAIYFPAVYDNSVRISQNNFVSSDSVSFDVDAVDHAIGIFCPGDFIAIPAITTFAAFPFVGVPWTNYLLESFVYRYSRAFKLVHSQFNSKVCVGAIVRADTYYSKYEQVLGTAAAQADIPLESSPVLDFLCEEGFLNRRRQSPFLDSVLSEARQIRSRKK